VSLLFDQNLSRRLPTMLAPLYAGSQQVIGAGFIGADDRMVWAYAVTQGLAVVTKDVDFRDMALSLGPPPKVIWLRIGNGPTRAVEALLRFRMQAVLAYLAGPSAILELP
jgi:predicted nuclease of predicted toxin-antitoxin system